MKYLHFLETGDWLSEKRHNLIKIFDVMTKDTREHIQTTVRSVTKNSNFHKEANKKINELPKMQFSWDARKLIANSSEAFEKWRYIFENPESATWFAGYSELQAALDSRIIEVKS